MFSKNFPQVFSDQLNLLSFVHAADYIYIKYVPHNVSPKKPFGPVVLTYL